MDLSKQPPKLVGSWQLICWDIRYGDGRPASFPYGSDASGLILYTPDGAMSACIARAGRSRLSSDSVRSAPPAERLAAFESYFQYAGSYEIRAQAGRWQVVHRVSLALNPNFVGTEQVRDIDFAADGSLTLSAEDTLPGSTVLRQHRLVWRRS